jgi:pyruvate dehydrogenase E2 component (dihydrolipoamide acetyltransferase)
MNSANQRFTAVVMPKWGVGMEEGTISEWLVAEGATVAEGQVLATIETGKANNDLQSPAAGRIARLTVASGANADVGALLGVLAVSEVSTQDIDDFVQAYCPAISDE